MQPEDAEAVGQHTSGYCAGSWAVCSLAEACGESCQKQKGFSGGSGGDAGSGPGAACGARSCAGLCALNSLSSLHSLVKTPSPGLA